jgi:hypothetical protein
MFGKLLAFPFRLANVPIRAAEKIMAGLCGDDDIPKENRILSKPLEALAESIEESTGEESK